MLAARGSGFGAVLLDDDGIATFVLAARGSGLVVLLLGDVAVPVTVDVAGLAGVVLLDGDTFVLADKGLGRTASLSGALDVPTGFAPTPLVFVLPRGLGWTGWEEKPLPDFNRISVAFARKPPEGVPNTVLTDLAIAWR